MEKFIGLPKKHYLLWANEFIWRKPLIILLTL
jgi:hypothetical protein